MRLIKYLRVVLFILFLSACAFFAFTIGAAVYFAFIGEQHPEHPDIHSAACAGDTKAVRKFLDSGVSFEANPGGGMTPIQCAALEGHEETVEYLVSRGARMDLFSAAGIGDVNEAKRLLEEGAVADAEFVMGTPLAWAARNGHIGVVRLLADFGVCLDAKAVNSKVSALHHASRNGHSEVVSYLLSKGVDANIRDGSFSTPLFGAAMRGHIEIAQMLLSHGAEVDARDNSGLTALWWTVGNPFPDRREMVKLLLSEGADPEAKGHNGSSPMSQAEKFGRQGYVELMQRRQ